MDHPQHFDPTQPDPVSNDERQARHHELSGSRNPSFPPHAGMIAQERRGIIQSGCGLGRSRLISLGNVADDLVKISDGSFEPQNFLG
jgi:hypothetical protein